MSIIKSRVLISFIILSLAIGGTHFNDVIGQGVESKFESISFKNNKNLIKTEESDNLDNPNPGSGEEPDSADPAPDSGEEPDNPEPGPGEEPDNPEPGPEEEPDNPEPGEEPDNPEPDSDENLEEPDPDQGDEGNNALVLIDENEVELQEDEEPTDYLVKIHWGDMKFVYDYGGKWNPKTHSYGVGSESNEENPGWAVKYVDGINNRIVIENQSTYPVKITCTYTSRKVFNLDNTSSMAVTGAFDESKDFIKGLSQNDNYGFSYVTTNHKDRYECILDTYPSSGILDTTDYRKSVYFTLCGKPDDNRLSPGVPTKAGTIKVSVEPYSE